MIIFENGATQLLSARRGPSDCTSQWPGLVLPKVGAGRHREMLKRDWDLTLVALARLVEEMNDVN